jgi:hypothetical protein
MHESLQTFRREQNLIRHEFMMNVAQNTGSSPLDDGLWLYRREPSDGGPILPSRERVIGD